MSVQPHSRQLVPALPFGAVYYSAEWPIPPAPDLRTMTVSDQMYAYWGSDRDQPS